MLVRIVSAVTIGAAALIAGVTTHAQSPDPSPAYDILIADGTIYDGRGMEPYVGDVAITGDRIVAVGDLDHSRAARVVEARGLAVSPGFINMLSWADESLLIDGRSQSDLRQGVTLEIFGEGTSMGPLTDAMREELRARQGQYQYDVSWTSLSDYLEHLESQGISTNVASFVGATTIRIHELGYEDRAPTAAELQRMQELVRRAMEEGALGVGSSLIYAPAFYSTTEELIALAEAAAEYCGIYTSHMRSEAAGILDGLEELITIARTARIPANIYHLKASGQANWPLLDPVIARVEEARAEGLQITADVYPYTAGSTGLNATMPPWVQEGGYEAWTARLRDPAIRSRVIREMATPSDWSNSYLNAGGAEGVLLVGFQNEALQRQYGGLTLAEVARRRGTGPEETAIDLVIEDGSAVDAVFFIMSEENVRRKIGLPWVAVNSDSESVSAEGVFLESNPHPRAYGSFARILGRYVREEGLLPLSDAIRKMTSFPAETLHLRDRGQLREGYFADVVIFDPRTVIDRATYEDPHQYAEGVVDVFVNGVQVLEDGEHTGALPGRVVRGPGWTGWNDRTSAGRCE